MKGVESVKIYVDKNALQDYTTKLIAKEKTIFASKTDVGTPLVASTVAGMTDHDKIYVYVGSETGYTSGNWYYWDGSAWTSGGIYNSEGFVLDDTLTSATEPAQAKAVGDKVNQLSEEIDPLKSSFYTVAEKTDEINAEKTIFPFEFRVGNIKISDNGWVYEDSPKTRVSTRPGVTYHLKPGDVISLSDYTLARMYIGWKKDSDGTYGNTGAWKITDVVVADAGEYVINIESIPAVDQTDVNALFGLLSIVRADADGTIEEVLNSIKSTIEPGINLLYNQNDWSLVKASVDFKDDGIIVEAAQSSTWISAYIDINTTDKDYINISFDSIDFVGTLPSDASTVGKIRYGFVSGGAVTWKGWIDHGTIIDVSSTNSVRVALYVSTSQSVSSGVYVYYHNIQVEYGIIQSAFSPFGQSAIDVYARDAVGFVGNHEYLGDRVNLESPMVKRKCAYAVWKDFLGTEIPDLSTYGLHNHQSMAIYGGYVFMFQSGGGVVILDFSTKNILSTATLSQTVNQHANSAQFIDVYYDANDEFPLLCISRCGNSGVSSGVTDPALDALEIYRVQRSDDSFTFTLVKSIIFNANTYGSSWCVDNNTHTLYSCYYLGGNWSITENNPVCFSSFKLPDATELRNAQTVTLTASDVLYGCEIPFVVYQGMTAKNGIVYAGVQITVAEALETKKFRHRVYAIDVFAGAVKSDISLKIAKEPEGVAIYNGKMYVSQRNGSDTAGTNPAAISQFTF